MSVGNFRLRKGDFGDAFYGFMEQGSYQFFGPLSMLITVAFRAWDAGAWLLGFRGSNLEPGLHP